MIGRDVVRAVVVIGFVVGLASCIGDPPTFSLVEDSGKELWDACELPARARIRYRDLNPGLVDDGTPKNVTLARTDARFREAGCEEIVVTIDPRASGRDDYSACCTLIHESVHIAQIERLCDVCSTDTSAGGFTDCIECWMDYCDPEMEAPAYRAACQVSTACGAGGKGRGGRPPPEDEPIAEGADPGLACFGEWYACERLFGNRELPEACHGVTPDCGRIIDKRELRCGCPSAAVRTYGCSCPEGRACTTEPTGECACR